MLSCGIFRVEGGLEVRCVHGPADLSRSQVTREIGTARRIAEQWRQEVLASGGVSKD